MKTIYIDANELKAVRVFAAKEDVRYYLKGVLVQATARETRIVATDGTMLAMFDREQQNENIVFEELIVPIDAIDALKPDGRLSVPVRVKLADGRYSLQQYDDRELTFKPVEGRFPDYRRVVPEKVSGEPVQFPGDMLVRIDKAQKIISKNRHACIWHNGADAAVFHLTDAERFIGVAMPLRFSEKEPSPPAPDTSSFRRALTVEKIEAAETTSADDLL